jgi:hypothetical protein
MDPELEQAEAQRDRDDLSAMGTEPDHQGHGELAASRPSNDWPFNPPRPVTDSEI